jgi:hypothetical protein
MVVKFNHIKNLSRSSKKYIYYIKRMYLNSDKHMTKS